MIGLYIECEWCGSIQRTTVSRTHKQFRKFVNKMGWIYLKNEQGIEWDFCSKECYENIKINGSSQD